MTQLMGVATPEAVTPITAPPAVLAREALMKLADRVADGSAVAVRDLLSSTGRTMEIFEARWIFLWCANIVLGAKNWQVADLCGFPRKRVADWHRHLHDHVNTYPAFRDRLDHTTRRFYRDTAWKRPLRGALKAHRLSTDGRRK